jgi:hypothetical protein
MSLNKRFSFRNVVRLNLALLACLVLPLSACGDGGQSSDNGAERGPWVYSTQEEGNYILNMAASVGVNKDDPTKIAHSEIVLKTEIPKKLLSVCFPYSRSKATSALFKVKSLPNEVFCNKISFVMNYATGEEWTGSEMLKRDNFEKFLRERPKPDPLIFGKVPEDETNVDFERYFEIKADVFVRKNQGKFEYPEGSVMRRNKIGYSDGFSVYRPANSSWTGYFDDQASDGLGYVLCVNPPDRMTPRAFCKATIVINDRLIAEVDFIDFRLHGGRAFLQERVRAFKKHMCPILKCNDSALSAAKVVGGF